MRLLFLLAFLPIITYGQTVFKKEQSPRFSETVVDPDNGVILFEKFNKLLAGDSIRHCKNYACQGWVEDYYENEKLLHRGYYIEGQLSIYKNYYPDGTLEREFKSTSLTKCELTTYHPNGKVKIKAIYSNGSPLKYEEYYENGQLEYLEENHKSLLYYITTQSYYENGSPESLFHLTDPKKLFFSKAEFFENGNKREEGTLIFSKSHEEYIKTGKWSYYDESGKLTHESIFENGRIIKTNNY
jgi:antitoxin component YwqK of YwqJK toxin-antitoxin module